MKKFLNLLIVLGVILVLSACSSSSVYIDNEKFINITESENDLSTVTDDEYLVYFYAVTCVHCANFKSTVSDYLEKDDALKIYGFNLDKENLHDSAQKVLEKYQVPLEGTPTLVYIKDGKLVTTLVGTQELDAIPSKGSYKNFDIKEEAVVEEAVVEEAVVEETVEKEAVEKETVENETVEKETVENETVEKETIEKETVEK